MSEPVLQVNELKVRFATDDGLVKAVDGVSFSLPEGGALGVVGESGSGKSVSWLAVMGLLDRQRTQIEGEVLMGGRNLLELKPKEMRSVRGKQISMIFQDPMTSLHPYYRVGDQIAEAVLAHEKTSKKAAADRAVQMLGKVSIPKPAERARQYPHEFSGGMRQRAMIAMALALDPVVLVADEPTTALDVTVQAQILDLIQSLRDELNTTVVIITHDMGVVAEYCDHIAVMYAGRIIERGKAEDIYYRAHHPYAWGLLDSIPRLDDPTDEPLTPIKGLPPSLIHVPSGCSFHPRCPYVMERCLTERPELLVEEGEHTSACHLSLEEKDRLFTDIRAARR